MNSELRQFLKKIVDCSKEEQLEFPTSIRRVC